MTHRGCDRDYVGCGFARVHERSLSRDRFAQDDRTRSPQACDDPSILGRDTTRVDGGSVFGRDAFGVDDVFETNR